jgi:hypothetical protein
MGTISASSISNTSGTVVVPTRELQNRVIQQNISDYTAGEWNPTASYAWVPGSYVDFTPLRTDSRISYIWRCPHAWSNANHAISHWKFYVNGEVYYYHSTSGRHIEDGSVLKWDVPSWGTTEGRIGYQIRSYQNDNHEVRLYTTYYWDGTGRSAQTCNGQLIIEEYVSTGTVAGISTEGGVVYTAK